MLLANSTITGNIAHIPSGTINGAGVANYETSLTVLNCTIANNSFVETGGTGLGAGLFNSGTLTIYGSTISNNTGPGSADAGGGIYNTYSNLPCTIVDSTLAGNSAKTGGGIWAMTPITLTNDTLAGNTATTGGGIYDATAVTMYNTLVANNTATKGADIALSTSGSPTLDGLNDLVADGSTIGTTSIKDGINGNIVGHPANIGTLQYYGGPTQTLALQSTSLAINAGGGLTIVTTNGGINATATSFTVGNAAAIAVNAGSYLIQVNNEVMTVTNVNLSTNTLTVTSAAHNATSHNQSAARLPCCRSGGQPASYRQHRSDIGTSNYIINSTPTVSIIPNYQQPETTTTSSSAVFTFSGFDTVTPVNQLVFMVSLDGNAFTTATSPVTYTTSLPAAIRSRLRRSTRRTTSARRPRTPGPPVPSSRRR